MNIRRYLVPVAMACALFAGASVPLASAHPYSSYCGSSRSHPSSGSSSTSGSISFGALNGRILYDSNGVAYYSTSGGSSSYPTPGEQTYPQTSSNPTSSSGGSSAGHIEYSDGIAHWSGD